MSEKINYGEFFNIGFDGTTLDSPLKDYLLTIRPGGVTLFQRNIKTPEQTATLISSIKNLFDEPPVICVDFEGGRVNRLKDFLPDVPAPRELAEKNEKHIYDFAFASGSMLASLGFDLNFAPVVELYNEDYDNGIGDRAYNENPRETRKWSEEYLLGLTDANIAGCLKHFPGLTRTTVDSHLELPEDRRILAEFLEEDLIPYDAPDAPVELVMVAHCSYPGMFRSEIPASLNPEAYMLLKQNLVFHGLAITDDLTMGALEKEGSLGLRAVSAFKAGADIAMICRGMEDTLEAFSEFKKVIDREMYGDIELHHKYSRLIDFKKRLKRPAEFAYDPAKFEAAKERMDKLTREVRINR